MSENTIFDESSFSSGISINTKKRYLVETIITTRCYHVIETDDVEAFFEKCDLNDSNEFYREQVDEEIASIRETSDSELRSMCQERWTHYNVDSLIVKDEQ